MISARNALLVSCEMGNVDDVGGEGNGDGCGSGEAAREVENVEDGGGGYDNDGDDLPFL